jgi:hypothetical protein
MIQTTIFDVIEKEYEPVDKNDTYLGPKSAFVGYQAYIKSNDWRKKREYALKILGCVCRRCETTDVPLQVHHKHYRTLYHERLEDVIVLCTPCHETTHRIIKREREERAYGNAFCTWAEKKYGEDAYEYMDMEILGEEFDEWLESKEDEYF